jgi:hypothetical protein
VRGQAGDILAGQEGWAMAHRRGRSGALVLGALLGAGAWASPVGAQSTAEVSLRSGCQGPFRDYLKKPNPGHFFYVEDSESGKHQCGFSSEDPGEFDRYPSSAQLAFTLCQNGAEERGIKARCELIAAGSKIVSRSYREAQEQGRSTAGGQSLAPDPMRCGQLPFGRWSWTERAFCDMSWHGPGNARGVVIWNHGIYGNVPQHTAPVPPVFRLLQARGWDVMKISRNSLGEASENQSRYRAVQATLEQAAARKREGYARVILAGQSFGGLVTVEAGESARDLYAVIAMAPGIRGLSATGSLNPADVNFSLAKITAERLVLVLPRDDAMFGGLERGPGAAKALAGRGGSFLLLDEKYDIVGHGGGTTGKFAIKYGSCVVRHLLDAEAGKGPIACQADPAQEWSVARELLPKVPSGLKLLRAADALPQELRALAGSWWGILEPAGEVVTFALVDVDGVGRRAMFSSFSGWRRGGLYDFSTDDGGVSFKLGDRGTVTVKGDTLTWTPSGPAKPQTAKLHQVQD